MPPSVELHRFGPLSYRDAFEWQQTTAGAVRGGANEALALLQHPHVYTLGRRIHHENILVTPEDAEVIESDRGGDVTYHGPGQLVVYTLIDMKRSKIGIRDLISALENSVIKLVADYGIDAAARSDAPGVYVDGKKLASVGLRVRRSCSYHGLSLNVAMDTQPFKRINPCGFDDLTVTQLAELGAPTDLTEIGEGLVDRLLVELGPGFGH